MEVRNNQERQVSFLKYYGINILDLTPELPVLYLFI